MGLEEEAAAEATAAEAVAADTAEGVGAALSGAAAAVELEAIVTLITLKHLEVVQVQNPH